MKKLVILIVLAVFLFLSGCEALIMSPDAWLDPHRWEEEEAAKAKARQSKATDSQQESPAQS